MCRGNIKLISEGNAFQTERGLLLALGYLIVPSSTRLVSGFLLGFKNAVAGSQFFWCDTDAELVVQVICGVRETGSIGEAILHSCAADSTQASIG